MKLYEYKFSKGELIENEVDAEVKNGYFLVDGKESLHDKNVVRYNVEKESNLIFKGQAIYAWFLTPSKKMFKYLVKQHLQNRYSQILDEIIRINRLLDKIDEC